MVHARYLNLVGLHSLVVNFWTSVHYYTRLNPLDLCIVISTHLKLHLSDAIYYFRWVLIIKIWQT